MCSPQVRGRLRLQAAVSLLHLAAVPAYADVVMKTPSLLNIALTTQVWRTDAQLHYIMLI
jgi:hypothetical protein